MGDDLGIANRLRQAGLRVIEVAGWQTAGSSDFNPRGSVNHHTAGGASGDTPSLSTCIYGRSDLPGPLCNVYQSREPDGRDIAYVISAGRANHAGDGGWKGLSGNSSVYGLEIEHTGINPLPAGRLQISAEIHAAMFTGDPAYCCSHREWTSRKIDVAENVDDNRWRQMVADARKPKPPPLPEEPDMVLISTSGKPTRLFTGVQAIGLKDVASVNAFKAAGIGVAAVTDRDYELILDALGDLGD